MNWLWILILIPIAISGILIAFFVVPKTPVYTPPTTTTTTRITTRTTTTTSTTFFVTTTTTTNSPCNLFKGECKIQCSPGDELLQASCERDNMFCCRSTRTTTTTTTTSTTLPPGVFPT
ncbi:MAG: hypothetical protein J4452_01055 [Candidatus Aenigmarchaeota archaeon]|nr:hypothetical protein [Candidatus Aenigmarchaeota archaeon]